MYSNYGLPQRGHPTFAPALRSPLLFDDKPNRSPHLQENHWTFQVVSDTPGVLVYGHLWLPFLAHRDGRKLVSLPPSVLRHV